VFNGRLFFHNSGDQELPGEILAAADARNGVGGRRPAGKVQQLSDGFSRVVDVAADASSHDATVSVRPDEILEPL
jgi:hypothetical protein